MYSPRNSFRFEGKLGKDAETKTTTNGSLVTFSVAVNERWKDTNQIEHKRTDWFYVELWGPATRYAASLKKGSQVIVEGKVQTGSYKDRDSPEIEHRTWTIKANSVRKIEYMQEEEVSDANEDA